MRFLKFLGLFSLAVTAIPPVRAQSCEPAGANGIDFICGELPLPFQPCSDFSVVSGRATTATTLWMLSEKHKTTAAARCLNLITQHAGNHTVYVESVSAGKIIPCKEAGISEREGRQCIGWDDMKAIDDLNDSLMDARVAQHMAELEKIQKDKKLSDKNFDIFLKNFLAQNNQMEQDSKNKKLLPKKVENLDFTGYRKTCEKLLKERKTGDSYSIIFARPSLRPDSPMYASGNKVISETTLRRNKALMTTLHNHRNGLAVSIMGKAHGNADYHYEVAAAQYIEDELKKGPHQNRYARLAMD